MSTLLVPGRFNGPPTSGNGGWTAGLAAAHLAGCPTDHARGWPTIEVTLRQPPPLDVEFDGDQVAPAREVEVDLPAVSPVTADTARAAEASYAGLRRHPFPTCFACGPDRAEGDGLRIFPGRVDEARVAATWTPHESVAEDYHEYGGPVRRASIEVTWAALDCIGGWSSDLEARPAVLGRMTAQVSTLPAIGVEHVVVGEYLGTEGRKIFTASTVHAPDGVVARAQHVWIMVDPAAFGSTTG